jgi:hypothetical protein
MLLHLYNDSKNKIDKRAAEEGRRRKKGGEERNEQAKTGARCKKE